MKTKKIEALEAVIAGLEISESELINWFNNRSKDKIGLIPTKLPLVYRRKNELEVLNGLDLSRKDELWGIQMISGVMVALKCGPGNNVLSATWDEVRKFARRMRLNGKSGILPYQIDFKEYWGCVEEENFEATVAVLKENDIEADGIKGRIWCFEEYDSCTACYYYLDNNDYIWDNKYIPSGDERVAVAF